MWWKHHDLASVPSTQGSFSLHTKHIHRPLFGGKVVFKKKYCVVFAIINFHIFLLFFNFYFNWALQFKACISIMSCFVSLKQSFLLPKDVFFPPLFLPFLVASEWMCILMLQLWLLALLFETGNKSQNESVSRPSSTQGKVGEVTNSFLNLWPVWGQP